MDDPEQPGPEQLQLAQLSAVDMLDHEDFEVEFAAQEAREDPSDPSL